MAYLEDHSFQHVSICYATNVTLAVGLLDYISHLYSKREMITCEPGMRLE